MEMDFSMACAAKSDEIFLHIALRVGCAASYDEPAALSNSHIVGIASYRARVLAGKAPDRNAGPSAAWVVFGRLIS